MIAAYLRGQDGADTRVVYVTTGYYGHKKTGPVVKATPTRITLRVSVGHGTRRSLRSLTKRIEDVRCDRGRDLDILTQQLTAFDNFSQLLNTPPHYRPTLRNTGLHRLLADAYDRAQQQTGDPRRAFRISR